MRKKKQPPRELQKEVVPEPPLETRYHGAVR